MSTAAPGATAVEAVGVIGLGDIGSGVAKSLARAGLPLVVCDLRTEATDRFADRATVATSPAAVGRTCDVVLVAVVDDAQVRSVLGGPNGAIASAAPGTAVVVLSTVQPDTVRALAAEAAPTGVAVVDCGVSGGPAGAAAGELVCMVGGDAETIARLGPVLDAMSSLVVHMGPVGTGVSAKLARNVIQYGSWLAAYEGQRLAEAAGIELSKLAEVVRASDARIGGASTLMFRPTAAPFTDADDEGLVTAMRSAALLAKKDLQAALATSEALEVPLPLAAMAEGRCEAVFGVGPDGAGMGAGRSVAGSPDAGSPDNAGPAVASMDAAGPAAAGPAATGNETGGGR